MPFTASRCLQVVQDALLGTTPAAIARVASGISGSSWTGDGYSTSKMWLYFSTSSRRERSGKSLRSSTSL